MDLLKIMADQTQLVMHHPLEFLQSFQKFQTLFH